MVFHFIDPLDGQRESKSAPFLDDDANSRLRTEIVEYRQLFD
jgi:hypothetical protein